MANEQSGVLLSVCIPTYNRAEFLRQALASILAQTDGTVADELEIVVSDNASSDDTDQVVAQLRKNTSLKINYFRNERNVGFDRNCLTAVERASGRYCWLLGDDDLLAAGALATLLQTIKANPAVDLFLGEKEDFYLTPGRFLKERKIMPLDRPALFDFRRRQAVRDYFKANKKLIAFFNFISVLVFSRAGWLGVEDKEKFVGSGYIHVYMVMSLLWGGAAE
jgi:abequosyltransferase